MPLPLGSTLVCNFVFKGSVDAVPRSLIDAARIDGLPDSFLWPSIVIRNQELQTLPLALSTFLSDMENVTGGAPCLLRHGARARDRALPARAAPLHRGLSGWRAGRGRHRQLLGKDPDDACRSLCGWGRAVMTRACRFARQAVPHARGSRLFTL
jgi:hypothetical protein